MNRKELRRQWVQYKQAEKAWAEATQFGEDFLALWLKEGGVTQEQACEMCNDLRKDS